MGDVPTASWTVTQPWRGVFGMLVCLGVAFAIANAFNMPTFMGIFTAWAICIVPIEVIVGLPWMGGTYPAGKFDNPWRGFAILIFMFFIATIAFWMLTRYIGGGAFATVIGGNPVLNVWIIGVVITTFFAVIAFGCWPFQKMSLPAKGFLTLLAVYLIWTVGFRLFNFDVLATGIPALHTGPDMPLYTALGPLAYLGGINPSGAFAWEGALTFYFWMVAFLFVFVHLGMWPISKFKSLMVQPILGIVLFIACFVLALIAYAIGVWAMDIDPIRFLLYIISFAFGMLAIIFMFQMWPGRMWSQPTGGFINLLVAVVLAIVAFFAIRGFCSMTFGPEYYVIDTATGFLNLGPDGWFAMANVMLALIFPAWAVYGPVFDFWPLPPTPGPPP